MKKRLLLSIFAIVACVSMAMAEDVTTSKLYLDDIELENATMTVSVERDGSTVTLAAGDEVSVGETLTFTVTAANGYYFSNGTTSKIETVTLTADMAKEETSGTKDLTSSLTAGDGTWSALSDEDTYENATRTSGWKVVIPRTDENEKTISVTMPASGTLSFEYAVNNGFSGYGTFYVYLYINDTQTTRYDEFYTSPNSEDGYKRVYSASGVSVSKGDIVKWGIKRQSSGGWADGSGRQGYIGTVKLTYGSPAGLYPTLIDVATHQHSYGEDGKCTTCRAVHTYTLGATPTNDAVASTVVTRDGSTLEEGAELTFGDVLSVTVTPNEYTVWSDDNSLSGARIFEITVDNSDPNETIAEKVALAVYPTLAGAAVDNATVAVTVTRNEQTVTLTNGNIAKVGETLSLSVAPASGYYFSDATNVAKEFTVTLTSEMISGTTIDISSELTAYAVHQHSYSETDGKCTICQATKTYTLTIPTSETVASTVVKKGDTELAAGTTLTFGDELTVIVTKANYAVWSDNANNTDNVRTFTITVDLTDPNEEIAAKVALAVCLHTSQTSGVCKNCGHYDALTDNDKVDGYYQIASAGDLMAFADIVNGTNGATKNNNAKAKVTTNIDFTSITVVSYTPIGNDATNYGYAGTFDGDGHTITLNINSTSGNQGLIGRAIGQCTIQNVTVDGTIKSTNASNVGGIVGRINSSNVKINNCTNKATVLGENNVGGIVGFAYYDTNIDGCTNEGSIKGNSYVGGIVGYGSWADVTITKCVNKGELTGASCVGGIVGYYKDTTDSYSLSIENSANRGTIIFTGSTASNNVGSLVGGIDKGKNTLTGCYNSATSSYPALGSTSGTLTITRCYDINSTSTADNTVSPCTSDELKSGALCYNLNGGVSDLVWYQKIDTDDYPMLTAEENETNVVNYIKKNDAAAYFNTGSEADVANTDAAKFCVVDELDATETAQSNLKAVENSVNMLFKNSDDETYTCANAKLLDGTAYSVDKAYTAEKFTYDRTLATGNKGISTFMLPIAVSASEVNGKVYKLSSLEDNTLNFEEVTGMLEANTPYIVENTTTSEDQKLFTTSLSNVSVSAMEAGTVSVSSGAAIHYGAYTTKTSAANGSDDDISGNTIYGYADGKFIKATGTWTLPAFHTMILVPTTSGASGAPALSIDLGDGGTSGISSTAADGAETVDVYSVSGVRLRTGVSGAKALNGLPAGIYVVNGKKLVKK